MSQKDSVSLREAVYQYAEETYGHKPEYLWASKPRYGVLRHQENKKWYALVMDIPREKLGLTGKENVDVLNLKCDPVMIGSVRMEKGIFPAYHMNKNSWISVLLDGTVPMEQIQFLLQVSFSLTASRPRPHKAPIVENRDWLIPANPSYYDVEAAFKEQDTILWKQSSHVHVGDTVYLYLGAPVSAIRFKCRAVEVDIPRSYQDENIRIRKSMKIQLVHTFRRGEMTFEVLKSYGVFAVRGPRGIPNSLRAELERLCGEG